MKVKERYDNSDVTVMTLQMFICRLNTDTSATVSFARDLQHWADFYPTMQNDARMIACRARCCRLYSVLISLKIFIALFVDARHSSCVVSFMLLRRHESIAPSRSTWVADNTFNHSWMNLFECPSLDEYLAILVNDSIILLM